MPGTPEWVRWIERADRYAEPDTLERAWADCLLGGMKLLSGHAEEGSTLLSRSLDLARRLEDPNTFWYIAGSWLWWLQAPKHAAEQLQLAEELTAWSRAGVSIPVLAWALIYAGITFSSAGQRGRAEETYGELQILAERTQGANYLLWSMGIDATVATWDGRLEEAVEIVQRMIARGQGLGLTEFTPVVALIYGLRSQLYLGKNLDSLERGLQNELWGGTPGLELCLIMAHLGRVNQVEEALQQRVLARRGIGSATDETSAWDDIVDLEAAVLVRHRRSAELLLRRLAGSGVHSTGMFPTCTTRHLGAAAALLGRPGEARTHYKEALKVATDMRFRPEVALTRLQIAELLLEHYPDEKANALEHLDFAISEFREMKMQPSLERALRHKEILGA